MTGFCWHKFPRWGEPFNASMTVWTQGQPFTKEAMLQKRECMKCGLVVHRKLKVKNG